MNKLIAVLLPLLIIAAVVFLITTSPEKEEQAEQMESPETMAVVKMATPGDSFQFIYELIKANGLDEKNGIQVEAVPSTPADNPVALMSGSVDVAPLAPIQLAILNLKEDNPHLVMFAPAMKVTCPLLVNADSDYSSLEDLEGKTLGTLAPNTGIYTSLKVAMAKLGLDIDEYFTVQEGVSPAIPPLLYSNDIDAMISTCGEVSAGKLLASEKVTQIDSIADMLSRGFDESFEGLLLGLSAKKEWLDNNPESAQAFYDTFTEAISMMTTNPEIFASEQAMEMFELTPASSAVIQTYLQDNSPYAYKSWTALTSDLETFISEAVSLGLIPKAPERELFLAL